MTAYRVNKISQVEKSQLSEFYKETYHKRYKSLTSNWRWWYRSDYTEFEPLVLLIDNKIIGQAALIPIDLDISGKKIQSICFVDFAILPKYQGKGFGQILTKEWMKICSNQITFCNDESLRVFKRFGWKNNLSTKRLIKPLNILRFLPITKKFDFNFINKNLKFFLNRRHVGNKIIKPFNITNNFKLINDSFKIKNFIKNNQLANIIRDEKWLNWRLIECPYNKDIYFFEYKNNFAIVHIFTTDNIKKLNILFTYSVEKNFDQELFELITNWSLNNEIDLIWSVTRDTEMANIFPKIFSKTINFASWSSDNNISTILEKGLSDPQGIDSDIDSNLYIE
tara:strand:+ start:912 stop:1925 length:1014 start_codon:yes stop_codon:yes gene_type:complete